MQTLLSLPLRETVTGGPRRRDRRVGPRCPPPGPIQWFGLRAWSPAFRPPRRCALVTQAARSAAATAGRARRARWPAARHLARRGAPPVTEARPPARHRWVQTLSAEAPGWLPRALLAAPAAGRGPPAPPLAPDRPAGASMVVPQVDPRPAGSVETEPWHLALALVGTAMPRGQGSAGPRHQDQPRFPCPRLKAAALPMLPDPPGPGGCPPSGREGWLRRARSLPVPVLPGSANAGPRDGVAAVPLPRGRACQSIQAVARYPVPSSALRGARPWSRGGAPTTSPRPERRWRRPVPLQENPHRRPVRA